MSYLSTPGIFNVLDPWSTLYTFGMQAGPTTASGAEENARILQAAIWKAQNENTTGTACAATGNARSAIILIPGNNDVPAPVNGGGTDNGRVYEIAIPSESANPAAIVINCGTPLRFLGTGSITLKMVPNVNGVMGDMFSILTSGDSSFGENTGGITFEDIQFTYDVSHYTGDYSSFAAIHTIPYPGNPNNGGADNVRLYRCILNDCPIGAWFQIALQPTMLDCTIRFNAIIGIGVRLGDGFNDGQEGSAKEFYIADCVFGAQNGGSTAIEIFACDHGRVDNCQIDSFTNGILITPGGGNDGYNVLRCTFTAVTVYVGTDASGNVGKAVVIQPQSSAQNVSQLAFTSCSFELGATAEITATGGPGILVDNTLGGDIDSIRFVSCFAARFPGPGLEINGSSEDPITNVEVLGGEYMANKYTGISTPTPCGIYANNVNGLKIVGTSCLGTYNWILLSHKDTAKTQLYGIYLDAACQNVIVNGCDIRGNATAGIYVEGGVQHVLINSCNLTGNGSTSGSAVVVHASSVAVAGVFISNCDVTGYSGYSTAIAVSATGSNAATLEVTNCVGYNDQAVEVGGGTISVISSIPIHAYTHGYYGPVTFYVGANTSVTGISVGSTATLIKTGTVVLPAGVGGTIFGTFVSLSITMIGQ